MRMSLISYPHYVSSSSYEDAIERMILNLRREDGVVSIFQIGSTNNPGISDIDMLVVFEDDAKCSLDPLKGLSKTDRYLFSHSLYGISRSKFSEVQRYTFFHNYTLLWGEDSLSCRCDLSEKETRILKIQTALEYLLKMYISSTVELTYGVVKVRSLLMHVKALLYDLEFLAVSSCRLSDLIHAIINWRELWFDKTPDKRALEEWFQEFCVELAAMLKTTLQTVSIYLPSWANMSIARHVTLVQSGKFEYTHKGITLPAIIGGLGRKYFNIQHRFNTFIFKIPIVNSTIPSILDERFEYARETKLSNGRNLPYFIPPNSCLNVL